MHDIRDFISGPLHIARIVFGSEVGHVQNDPYREEKRMHCYIGAASNDRFLLIEIPSPETANELVDLGRLRTPPSGPSSNIKWPPTVASRTSDTDFYCNYPMITPRPRSPSGSPPDNALQARFTMLKHCLQFNLTEINPGSIRWDGDHFTAEYSEQFKNTRGRHSFSFGENTPESVKEKFLADLLNPPANKPKQTVRLVEKRSIHFNHGSDSPPEIPRPALGSIEAKIMDFYAARREARIARGFSADLQRDAEGKAIQIRFDNEAGIRFRIEFEYADAANPPSPFPRRIKRFTEVGRTDKPDPCHQIDIYDVRLSDRPLDDAAFVPWPYLNEDSYVRGKPLGEHGSTLADPKDHAKFRRLMGR